MMTFAIAWVWGGCLGFVCHRIQRIKKCDWSPENQATAVILVFVLGPIFLLAQVSEAKDEY